MIDKIIPRHLDSDTDERLVEEGVMTDALNVGMFSTTGGTGVLQNAISTNAIQLESGAVGVSDNAVVIGSVSDAQRGFIYFFVKDTVDANLDGIYRYEASTNTYKRVFAHSWFGFRVEDTVQADVVNAAFQQDGFLQSIIYFTDGYNPPRKINVDRAILGEYDSYSDDKLDYALNVIKAAPLSPPSFYFDSDSDVETNNFSSNTFQYAFQYIYKDGEVSSVSPHSVLAFPRWASVQGIEELGFGRQSFTDNVCIIDINWSSDVNSAANIPEVKRVRLLAKSSYEGSFFVIDEFDPNENLSREVYGTPKVIYDSQSSEYRFYNEGAYSSIPYEETLKLYDNVPFTAVGQSVSGNRLLYSNYTEGRPNHSVAATLTPVYSDAIDGVDSSSVGSLDFEYDPSPAIHNLGKIAINVDDIFTGGDTIPAGTTTTIRFEYDPSGSFTNDDVGEYAITVDATDSNGDSFQIGLGSENATHSGGIILKKVLANKEVTITITNNSEITNAQFASLLNEKFENIFWSKTYSVTSTELLGEITNSSSSMYSDGDPFTFDDGLGLEVLSVFSLNSSIILSDTNTVLVTPQVYLASISGHEGSTGSGGYTIGNQTFQGGLTYYINNSSSPTLNSGKSWHDPYSSTEAFYVEDESAFTDAVFSTNTFKSNCTHELGVVYYDKYNRCGHVNKLGSFYVAPFGDSSREGKQGACSVSINFSEDAPDWAERYQIVYPGMSSYSSVLQYTSGGAFYNTADNDKRVYLSLRTLSDYQDQKSSNRQYSFTEGDKLRVISYDNAMGDGNVAENIQYPRSNSGTVIEFNIVDVIQNPTELSGITFYNQHEGDGAAYTGEFLVLEAPSVATGVQVTPAGGGTNENLKYTGFDYFSISGTAYPGESTTPTKTNYWGQRSVIEIVSPRKTTSDRVYYEVGSSRKVGVYKGATSGTTDHGPSFILSSGDLHLNPISCLTPFRDDHSNEHTDGSASNWNQLIPDHWQYKLEYLESHSVSDFFSSDRWDRGRAHVVYEDAATINRFNGVTWSDLYEEDVSVLSLSSFTPSTANFFSYESKFGAVNYLANFRSDLLAIQENKMSIAPVNKEFLNYADGSASVAVSNTVIGAPQYTSGDYGIGSDTSSALVYDGQAFFVDRSRRKVMRYAGGQLEPISDKGVSSLFADEISASSSKLISGYDPGEDMYYVTIAGSPGTTVGYNVALGKWQSKYSFVPDCYSLLDDVMFSFKSADISSVKYIMHSHNGATRLNFYGMPYSSEVSVISKYSPDSVKVFNALSLHSDEAWGARVTSDLGQDTGDGNMPSSTFDPKEGVWYRNITGNNVDTYKVIGKVNSSDGGTHKFTNKLMGMSIPIGAILYVWDNNAWQEAAVAVNSVSSSDRTIFTTGTTSLSGFLVSYKLTTSHTDGDRIRGHYAKIKLTNNSSNKVELFSISAHISNSPLNHALGQQ